MVGVGDTIVSKDLGDSKKLELNSYWESHGNQVLLGQRIDGKLQGFGATSFTIEIDEGEETEPDVLQEFTFTGSCEITLEEIPPNVREAFETRCQKLTGDKKPRDEGASSRVDLEAADRARIRREIIDALRKLDEIRKEQESSG